MLPAPHLNEYLKKFLSKTTLKAGSNNPLKPEHMNKIVRSPYLTLGRNDAEFNFSEATVKELDLQSPDGLLRVPFPMFRYCVDYVGADGKYAGSMIGCVTREEGSISILNFCKTADEGLASVFQVMTITTFEDNLQLAGKLFRTKDLTDVTNTMWEPLPQPKAKFAFETDRTQDGKIRFDTAAIANPVIRQFFETMSPERQQAFIERALKESLHRHMSEDGFYKDPTTVINRLTSTDLTRILNGVKDDIELDNRKLDVELKTLEKHVEVTNAANDLHAALKAIGGNGWITSRFEGNDEMKRQALFFGVYRALHVLAYEYLMPQNFTAKVTPKAVGKSVEWIQAREHYTTIHRRHEANSKSVKEGQIVKTDSNKSLTRSAHTRRAHTRLLSHPRYTYAKGQRVQVRATWCGPKEWQDTAGQTYRILVPVSP
jgi:hypothetical protein